MKTGSANLPLHTGSAPPWLFNRMCLLAGQVAGALVYEYGQDEFLRRISDPHWFQALACTLGFDWHSSGATTVTTAALKQALSPETHGIAVAGGKGKTSMRTPQDIQEQGASLGLTPRKVDELVYASKMSAKVDSALVQDGYRIYHHAFFFNEGGNWAVVQQGMNLANARRYHWLSDHVKSFIEEPHMAICTDQRVTCALDLTSRESEENRHATLDLVKDGPTRLAGLSKQRSLTDFLDPPAKASGDIIHCIPELSMPRRHGLLPSIDIGKEGMKALQAAYEIQPQNYEELVALNGIGPSRIRALSLISELIYGASPSWKDPARYSFAHGGKDGTPYPVDRETFDGSIEMLKEALDEAKIDKKEKYQAIKRLHQYAGQGPC